MNIQNAIENIIYFTKKFPKEEFTYISGHPKEAIPYLYSSIDYVIENNGNVENDYELHLYAMFFLAEFKDRKSFKRIVKLSSLPSDTVDRLLGDVISEDLGDILYNTYDG